MALDIEIMVKVAAYTGGGLAMGLGAVGAAIGEGYTAALANAAVILDEAQNTTSMQMKMFLTRLGENSRMIVTGDPSQIDLPSGVRSGLVEALDLLKKIKGVSTIRFKAEDVVRHRLVADIVNAYDNATRKSPE